MYLFIYNMNIKNLIIVVKLLVYIVVITACDPENTENANDVDNENKREYFSNPIKENGADPWMIFHKGAYYYSESDGSGSIYITKSSGITNIELARPKLVWNSKTNEKKDTVFTIWGPHLNYLQGNWYIYFAAQKVYDPEFLHQRMWVLRADSQDPLGNYSMVGEVLNSNNTEWAIDGSVLERANGDLYFVWSGIEDTTTLHQHSYIARMIDPTLIDTLTITKISSPTESWETSVRPIQEGQRPLYVDWDNKTIIMYSANASWTEDYCLASLTNETGCFLDPSSWVKSEAPLFQKNASVFGPGGASYVKSPDSTEDWIIYHAQKYQGSGWERNIRTQKFSFDENKQPVFGEPVQEGISLVKPSGE